MAVALTRYFENLRYLYTLYMRYSEEPNSPFENKNLINYAEVFNTTQANNLINLLNIEESLEMDKMQYIYIKETFRFLLKEFKDGINEEYQTLMTQRLALYVIFSITLFVIYIIIWLPLVNQLKVDIQQTKSMLSMIPLKVMQQITTIQKFIKKMINEKAAYSNM